MGIRMRAVRNALFVFLLLVHPIASGAAGEAAVAFVTDLEGEVVLMDDAGKPGVTILSEIRQNARLQLQAGGRLTAVYQASGQSWEMQGPAVVIFDAQQPDSESGAKPQPLGNALSNWDKELRIPRVDMASAAHTMMMIELAYFELIQPTGKNILDARPDFRWEEFRDPYRWEDSARDRSREPAIQYRFALLDESDKLLYEESVERTSLTLPASVQLKEAVLYTWRVSATDSKGVIRSNTGFFSLASAELRAQVEALRPIGGCAFAELVAYAAWLEQMALPREAGRVWRALAMERPDDPRLKAKAGH